MRLLIAVVTCEKYEARANVQRDTWVRDVRPDVDVKFFVGRESGAGGGVCPEVGDKVILDVEDDYPNVRRKVQRMFDYATRANYDFILKTDDDCVVLPHNWIASVSEKHDYVGRLRGPSGAYVDPNPDGITRNLATGWDLYGSGEHSYCSGYGYTLSHAAALEVAHARDNGDWAEDRFTGQVLGKSGCKPAHNSRYLLWPMVIPCRFGHGCPECIELRKNPIVICPHARPDMVADLYWDYKNNKLIPNR